MTPSLLHDPTGELAMLVQDAVSAASTDEALTIAPDDLAAYAAENHAGRMTQIVDAAADVPGVETLTTLEE